MDLGDLTYDTFQGRTGQRFRDAETGTELELTAVEDTSTVVKHVPEGHRTPFSLLFRGPGDTLLPQSIRTLGHEELGDLDIFLVPIAQDAAGYAYQAVFS